MEMLRRRDEGEGGDDLSQLPAMAKVRFTRPEDPESIINAMRDYQAILDATRQGQLKKQRAEIPDDLAERAQHLKAFGYFCDAAIVGICKVPSGAWLQNPVMNPDVSRLAEMLAAGKTTGFASGIDVIMADLREKLRTPIENPQGQNQRQNYALVFLYRHLREPLADEAGGDWIKGAQTQRASLRAAETTVTLANYIGLLGRHARSHSAAASDVDLNQLAVAAGLCDHTMQNPFLGKGFTIGAVTTSLRLKCDKPLAREQPLIVRAGIWIRSRFGGLRHAMPYHRREFKLGPHPFETLKRSNEPTTYIDQANVARVPKRSDMFARALFGDLGKRVQEAAKNGNYVRKSATAFAFRSSLGAFLALQDGPGAPPNEGDANGEGAGGASTDTKDAAGHVTGGDAVSAVAKSAMNDRADGGQKGVTDGKGAAAVEVSASGAAQRNADNIKAAAYYLGCDAVGLSVCPDWVYYSHDAAGKPLVPYHPEAISLIIDQGYETMEGASGDDWIACAQSMRAYLRFSLLGGVLAQHIRNLGYKARVHSVMDGEVLQPPLLLLSGLGEVSRIGEVILNPFLGPRLKSGVITTDMPMAHDRPIDFGLQRFCEACNKCARECPSGAITAGPKLMFNGYEIWKSDSQKCTSYRVSTPGGAMCGRCMKTCPWNLEGLFVERPFRWAAMRLPKAAKLLAWLDDFVGKGDINSVKKWWWDIEMIDEGPYRPASAPPNQRHLSKDLKLAYDDQTLAVYPAPLAPPPYAWPYPMDREAGIAAYQALIPASEHKARRQAALAPEHMYRGDQSDAPVMQLQITRVIQLTDRVTLYDLADPSGAPLPQAGAGAHIDVVVAPEFFRQFSLMGDPVDTSRYQIAVLRKDTGRGGSALMHRVFDVGRQVFISFPVNHFPLVDLVGDPKGEALLMGGGIGVTPLIAMGHQLHRNGAAFSLHYSCKTLKDAAFLGRLARVPWADHVVVHISSEGTRARFDTIFGCYQQGQHIYACGPVAYIKAVRTAADAGGFPEENCHVEHFSAPEQPAYVNHSFTLELARSKRRLTVAADKSATEVLAENGIHVDVKCADGICGICKCGLISGEVEHRDFVLSTRQRQGHIILCQSRAAKKNGVLKIDL